MKQQSGRIKRGTYDEIIKKTCKKFNFLHNAINKNTIVHRASASGQNLTVMKFGPLSPLHTIEPLVVSILLEQSAMRQPMRVCEEISLVNLMIQDTQIQLDLIEFRRKTNTLSQLGDTVGWDYWPAFMKRYDDIFSSKKSVRYDRKEEEWCTRPNFEKIDKASRSRLW